jgi:uncharacterized protein YkwD
MRYFSFALAVLAGVSLGCQSEKTDGRRAEGPDQTYPFTPRAAGNTRSAPTQLAIKGVGDPKVAPPATGAKIVPPPPPGPNAGQFDTNNLVRMINELRAKTKQQPLSTNDVLTRVAQEQAKQLAKGQQFDLNKASEQIKAGGYKLGPLSMNSTVARELNVAAVYAGLTQGAGGDIVVRPEYRDVGIGIDTDANNNYFIAVLYAGEQKQ